MIITLIHDNFYNQLGNVQLYVRHYNGHIFHLGDNVCMWCKKWFKLICYVLNFMIISVSFWTFNATKYTTVTKQRQTDRYSICCGDCKVYLWYLGIRFPQFHVIAFCVCGWSFGNYCSLLNCWWLISCDCAWQDWNKVGIGSIRIMQFTSVFICCFLLLSRLMEFKKWVD